MSSTKIKDEFYNITCSLGCWSHHFNERTTLKSELFMSIRKRKKCKILNSAKQVFYRKMHSGAFQPFKGLFGMFSPSLAAIWYMIADILMSRQSSCWDPDTQTHTGSRKQYDCMWHSGRVSPAGWRWRRWLPNSCRVQKALWPLSTVAAEICRARKLICHTESGTLGRYE